MTISLCMIVKNEESVLSRCLNSVKGLFDEIIIVDTGSTDNTVFEAKKFTKKVYNFKWINDFSAARNYSFSLAKSDFVMWLDADDIVTPTELEKLKELKQTLTKDISAVMLKYVVGFDEQNNPNFSYYRERILNRKQNFKWEGPVHEAININGNIIYPNIEIEHRKLKPNEAARNLIIYESMIKQKLPFNPRQIFYYARELYFNGKIGKAITMFNKFLKTFGGYKENYIEACLNLSKCYVIKKEFNKAKQCLFNSFNYDTPRSEILCQLGDVYFLEKNYKKAIYYYNLATQNEIDYKSGAFILYDCYNFIPYVQMCVCYFYLNNYEMAKKYHNLSKELKPQNPIVLNNEKVFRN